MYDNPEFNRTLRRSLEAGLIVQVQEIDRENGRVDHASNTNDPWSICDILNDKVQDITELNIR